VPGVVNRVGSMFTLFFTGSGKVSCFEDVAACDGETFVRFFRYLLEEGIYMAPSQFEAGFVSVAHTEKDIEETTEKVGRALVRLNKAAQ